MPEMPISFHVVEPLFNAVEKPAGNGFSIDDHRVIEQSTCALRGSYSIITKTLILHKIGWIKCSFLEFSQLRESFMALSFCII